MAEATHYPDVYLGVGIYGSAVYGPLAAWRQEQEEAQHNQLHKLGGCTPRRRPVRTVAVQGDQQCQIIPQKCILM